MQSQCCPPINFWMPKPISYETWYVYHDTWARFKGVLHKPLPSFCVSICASPIISRQLLCKNPPTVARWQLSKNITATMNTYTTKELLELSFYMWSMLYQGKVLAETPILTLVGWGTKPIEYNYGGFGHNTGLFTSFNMIICYINFSEIY
jgi:hypothetical protein